MPSRKETVKHRETGRWIAADEVRGDLDGGGRVHDIKVLPCWT